MRLSNGLARLCIRLRALKEYECEAASRESSQRIRSFFVLINGAKAEGDWRRINFNAFDVLGFPHSRLESIHSNVLAWLLDPYESHGFGASFLTKVLRKVSGGTFAIRGGVRVQREFQEGGDRPDIVVDGQNWRLVLEVKVGAPEGEDQSQRYVARWKSKGKLTYFVWVSPASTRPEAEEFIPVNFSYISELLSSLESRTRSAMFIRDFVEHLSREAE